MNNNRILDHDAKYHLAGNEIFKMNGPNTKHIYSK